MNISSATYPWCDPCDKSFKSQHDYQIHLLQHRVCGINNCSFVGDARVVFQHVDQQHKTGLYKEIATICSPEDIAKWRQDRKNKYPSVANVKLRQLAQEERKKRGEKLGENKRRFGRNDCRTQKPEINEKHIRCDTETKNNLLSKPRFPDRFQTKRRKKKFDSNKNATSANDKLQKMQKETSRDQSMYNGNLKKFQGTLALYQDDENHQSLAESLEINKINPSVFKEYSTNCNLESKFEIKSTACTLSSQSDSKLHLDDNNLDAKKVEDCLLNNNRSKLKTAKSANTEQLSKSDKNLSVSTDIINSNEFTLKEQDTQLKIQTEKLADDQPMTPEVDENCTTITDGDDEAPIEQPIKRSTPEFAKEQSQILPECSTLKKCVTEKRTKPTNHNRLENPKRLKVSDKNLLNYSKLSARRQNTMLEKLLQTEIRHERNVLLQCVRYVVNKNFFQIDTNNSL